jgi:hypothetical protein
MTGNLDEDCINYTELHDMVKAMIKLLTKNQVSTYASTTIYCILPSIPSYDGFDSDKYFA